MEGNGVEQNDADLSLTAGTDRSNTDLSCSAPSVPSIYKVNYVLKFSQRKSRKAKKELLLKRLGCQLYCLIRMKNDAYSFTTPTGD